jgi:hypothetical protein
MAEYAPGREKVGDGEAKVPSEERGMRVTLPEPYCAR